VNEKEATRIYFDEFYGQLKRADLVFCSVGGCNPTLTTSSLALEYETMCLNDDTRAVRAASVASIAALATEAAN